MPTPTRPTGETATDVAAGTLITVPEVAHRLGVNVRHIRRLIAERKIPYFKWGHLIRFDPTEIDTPGSAKPTSPPHRDMGATYDGVPGHEGYGQAIRADGTPIGAGSRAQPVGYTAQCSCGWADSHRHQPTERGYDHAIVTWERHHALPLLATATPPHITATLTDLRTALAELAHERPAAALRVIDDLTTWTDRLHRQATELAVTQPGPSRRQAPPPPAPHGKSAMDRRSPPTQPARPRTPPWPLTAAEGCVGGTADFWPVSPGPRRVGRHSPALPSGSSGSAG